MSLWKRPTSSTNFLAKNLGQGTLDYVCDQTEEEGDKKSFCESLSEGLLPASLRARRLLLKKLLLKKWRLKKLRVKKPASKKVAPKKTPAKKVAGKKVAVKKSPAKKPVAKKKPAAKVASKASPAKGAGKNRGSGDAPSAPVKNHDFKDRDAVVYPRHGVGQVVKIETTTINNKKIKLLAVSFEGDRMIMRIPYDRASETGLRPISSRGVMNKVMVILAGKARVRRTMWSRRAQEYTNKIQSGDVIAIGEVVRELWRDPAQPEQSFSERQMYQHALSRLAPRIWRGL